MESEDEASDSRVLGHELGAEVLAIGANVTHVAIGDRCAVDPHLNCGYCIACRRGKPNCCTQLKVLGVRTRTPAFSKA